MGARSAAKFVRDLSLALWVGCLLARIALSAVGMPEASAALSSLTLALAGAAIGARLASVTGR